MLDWIYWSLLGLLAVTFINELRHDRTGE